MLIFKGEYPIPELVGKKVKRLEEATSIAVTIAIRRRTVIHILMERTKGKSPMKIATIRGNKFSPDGSPLY